MLCRWWLVVFGCGLVFFSAVVLVDCGISSDRKGSDEVSPEATAYSCCLLLELKVWNSNCLLLHVSGISLPTENVSAQSVGCGPTELTYRQITGLQPQA